MNRDCLPDAPQGRGIPLGSGDIWRVEGLVASFYSPLCSRNIKKSLACWSERTKQTLFVGSIQLWSLLEMDTRTQYW